ncbi:MAG: hypothetical protein ACYS15_03185 [Planctomycetota bacterium]|jgi:hypothetical protein
MTATHTVPPPPAATRRREIQKIVTGDRFCTKCGYNLIGQQIVREEYYSMLIVRCPECATVASVQEYPLLGGWAIRWGALLAALWFITLVAWWPGSSGIVFGMSLVVTEESTRDYYRHLQQLHADSEAQTTGQAPSSTTQVITTPSGTIRIGGPGADFGKWWEQQDHAAILADAGGWRRSIHGEAFLILIPAAFMVFGVGWLWSVFLIQLKRRWLVVCGAAVMVVALFFVVPVLVEWHMHAGVWARFAANDQLGLPVMAISMGVLTVPLALGLWLGRPLTRLGVRALLPPRLRSSLALLWTAEGLAPPAP